MKFRYVGKKKKITYFWRFNECRGPYTSSETAFKADVGWRGQKGGGGSYTNIHIEIEKLTPWIIWDSVNKLVIRGAYSLSLKNDAASLITVYILSNPMHSGFQMHGSFFNTCMLAIHPRSQLNCNIFITFYCSCVHWVPGVPYWQV